MPIQPIPGFADPFSSLTHLAGIARTRPVYYAPARTGAAAGDARGAGPQC